MDDHNNAILRVASTRLAAMDGNLNLGIAPAAVTANYFQMANGTLRADSSFTLDATAGSPSQP